MADLWAGLSQAFWLIVTLDRELVEIALRSLQVTLTALPPVIVGLFVYILLSRTGPLGVLGLLFAPTAMIIAQVIIIVPLIASIAHQSLRDLWLEYHDLPISMIVTQTQKIKTLLWDARRALLTASLAGFGGAIGEVGAILVHARAA